MPPHTDSTTQSIDSNELNRRVLAEQLAMMCRYSQTSLALGVFMSLFFCWLVLPGHSPTAVFAWFVSIVMISAVRALLQYRYLREADRSTPERWTFPIKSAIAVNGLIWSVPSTFMVPAEPSAQVVLGVVSIGLAATTLVSLTPLRHAYTCFMTPYMLPIAIYYATLGGDFLNMSFGVFAFLLAMIGVAHRNTKGTEDLLRLRFDHAALAARLQRENEIVERANRDLEAQVTQRERTEAELRVAKAQAEAANRAKNQFLANMSHELRTPLNGVLGMSELLIRALANVASLGKPLKHAQSIHDSGKRLLHLIDDILDTTRIEAGAMRFAMRPFDPRRLIAETVEAVADDCARKGLAVNVSVAPSVPDQALGDALRLRQVLINLVSNAVKFTPTGNIAVMLSATPDSGEATRGRNVFRFSVSDTGIGIADGAHDHLFQPFSQLDESPTRKFGGTGLGLSICRQIVTAMGGRIGVESTPGKGSLFWFEVLLEAVPANALKSEPTNTTYAPLLRGRVLVVEDTVTNSDLIVEMLKLAGCETVTAVNGLEALEKIATDRFDAVLMDWHMPLLDGVEATRRLRDLEKSNADHPHLPVIALTASVSAGDRETCMQAGMDDFIAKPFTYDELVSVMMRWLPPKR